MRTTQTRKRSYAGSQSGRPYKKGRRYFKRRKGSSISRGYASKSTTVGYLRGKHLSARKKRQWKNRLIRSTDALQKWLGAGASTGTIATPASLITASYASLQIMKGAAGTPDITNPVNWVSYNGGVATITTAAGAAVCRGGYSEITLAHENAETIWYKIELCFTKDGVPTGSLGTPSAIGKFNSAFEGTSLNTDIKVLRTYEGFLENGTAKTFRMRIKPHRLDYQDFTGVKNVWFWGISVGNTVTASAVSVTCTVVEKAWFAGVDVVS